MSHATTVIARRVKEVSKRGGLRGMEAWMRDRKVNDGEDLVMVARSPRLKVYDMDSGWGRWTNSPSTHSGHSPLWRVGTTMVVWRSVWH
ncbi:SPARK domain-containing protein [Psidium guajava]|nr:SPARK domain-containing protein [Psidium guajava]